jgi:putative ABC transport system ATP-binding protein
MIKVKDLVKTYPGQVPVRALKGVCFEIPTGQFVAIMGASGSGKSTLLHQLALLDNPSSGQILLDDIDISTLSDQMRTEFRLRLCVPGIRPDTRIERYRKRLSSAYATWREEEGLH